MQNTKQNKLTQKEILLNFSLPLPTAHLGSNGLWLLWPCLFDGGAGGVGSKPSFYRAIVL
jgi:hypothetical protein